MTIAFMSLVSAMIAERLDVTIGLRLFLPVLCLGVQSVLQGQFSEQRGAPGLRCYAAVQVYPIAVLLLLLFLPPQYIRSGDLVCVGVFYLLARVFDVVDRSIYSLDRQRIIGHSLKHLTPVDSGFFRRSMPQKREPVMAEERLPHAA